MREKHYVRICRPRFEYAVIVVDAESEAVAKIKALGYVASIPDEKWTMAEFDPDEYAPHVEMALTRHDFEIAVETKEEADDVERAFCRLEDDFAHKYCLLKADAESGEGEVVIEPWFRNDAPNLLEHDIAGDWAVDLAKIAERGLENFEKDIRDADD